VVCGSNVNQYVSNPTPTYQNQVEGLVVAIPCRFDSCLGHSKRGPANHTPHAPQRIKRFHARHFLRRLERRTKNNEPRTKLFLPRQCWQDDTAASIAIRTDFPELLKIRVRQNHNYHDSSVDYRRVVVVFNISVSLAPNCVSLQKHDQLDQPDTKAINRR
jgi:hypothetical protein